MEPENLKEFFTEVIQPRLSSTEVTSGLSGVFKGLSGIVLVAAQIVFLLGSRLIGSAGNLVTFVSSCSLVLVITFYLLLDYDRLLKKITSWIPKIYREDTLRIFHRIDLQQGSPGTRPNGAHDSPCRRTAARRARRGQELLRGMRRYV